MSYGDEPYREDVTVPPHPPVASALAGTFRAQARRYLRAAHGPDYAYRAPETFSLLGRWIWAVACDAPDLGAAVLAEVEALVAQARARGDSPTAEDDAS